MVFQVTVIKITNYTVILYSLKKFKLLLSFLTIKIRLKVNSQPRCKKIKSRNSKQNFDSKFDTQKCVPKFDENGSGIPLFS